MMDRLYNEQVYLKGVRGLECLHDCTGKVIYINIGPLTAMYLVVFEVRNA